jgi:glutathione S-transferase
LFQEDLYPDFQSTEPSSDYDEWASGIDKPAKLQGLTPQVSTGVCPKKANFAAKLAGKQVAAAVATPAEINNDELIALRAEVERLKAA